MKKKQSTPRHGHIEGIFARVYDRNIRDYILVPVTPDTSIFQRILNLLFGNSERDRRQ